MPVVAIDDTDSRERGMCTTYVGAVLAERLAEAGATIDRHLLVRCNPAVEHKTRGNAAVALHVAADGSPPPPELLRIARETVDDLAETEDSNTHPGIVVAPGSMDAIPDAVARFATGAMRDHLEIEDALAAIDEQDYLHHGWGLGRGRIGALAAIGAWAAHDDWTYEHIAYREPDRWGELRSVDEESVFAAAAATGETWDTVDRVEGEPVCVPHTPGPVLYGLRGDTREAVDDAAAMIESEPVERTVTFNTNQGTDAHLIHGSIGTLEDGQAYRVDGTVVGPPTTRAGGHVFLQIDAGSVDAVSTAEGVLADGGTALECVAFEPTKRFRDHVRALRIGDQVTVCGEVAGGTLKLEKFAVRSLVETTTATPTCPECGRAMESAGADQGYRCRDCSTGADGPVEEPLHRELELGWYEVPPVARRHVAKPLVRGGFDAPVHPEE